jgi:thiamine biosynthesis lipoprotein
METVKFHAMGTEILIAADSLDDHPVDEIHQARQWFEDWEQIFSRFRSTSELSRFNQKTGKPVEVSAPFFEVVKLAVETEKITNGLITPTILNAIESVGYSVSFEQIIDQIELDLRSNLCSLQSDDQKIELDERNHSIQVPTGMRLDFGGIAKGWAAHQTMLRLEPFGPVLVDAGGDIAVSAPMLNGAPWPLAVANPFDHDERLTILMVERGGIATSGKDRRRWLTSTGWQHHLIDPRSSMAATTDVTAVTILAEDVITAERNAKMGVLLGSIEGKSWLDTQRSIDYLMILDDGLELYNQGFRSKEWNGTWNLRVPTQ